MFNKENKEEIANLKFDLRKEINELRIMHQVCNGCHVTGHKVDMVEYFNGWGFEYYHNGCYAEKFNKHLCPCKCGKWVDNKKKNI